MPAKEDRFIFPDINDTKVGESVYYINEDHADGSPSIVNALKVRCGFKGVSFQDVYPHFYNGTLQGYDLTPFFTTAEQARDEYVALANWRLDQKHDPNRPGDIAQRRGIQTNLDRLLALDWQKAVSEAREALEGVLGERKWGKKPIPKQEHLIGATIIGDDGKRAEVAEVELLNQDGKLGIVAADSLKLAYYTRERRLIKLLSQAA